MPTYEYYCLDCENKFDVSATLAQKEKGINPQCPKCRSKKAAQFFGGFAVTGKKTGSNRGCGPSSGPCCCQ